MRKISLKTYINSVVNKSIKKKQIFTNESIQSYNLKGYRDIMHYVCTPIYYIRCPKCVHSPNICNGLKNCMNKWNTTKDCIHLKRTLHAMIHDVNDGRTIIGLLFQLFLPFNFVLIDLRVFNVFNYLILHTFVSLHVTFCRFGDEIKLSYQCFV